MAPPAPTPTPSRLRLILLIILCAGFLLLTTVYLTINSSFTFPPSSSLPQPLSTPCSYPIPSDLNITIHQPSTPFAPYPLPPPHHYHSNTHLIPLLLALTRKTPLKLIAKIPLLAPDTYEPEGLLLLHPDRLILSSAEYTSPTKPLPYPINGTDRTPGAGVAHLQVFDLSSSYPFNQHDNNANKARDYKKKQGKGEEESEGGVLIADASLSHPESYEYHNSGVDYSGTHIFAALSQRRPNSSATIYAADPNTLQPTPILSYPDDHLGTVVVNPIAGGPHENHVTGLNWGSRSAMTFSFQPLPHQRRTTNDANTEECTTATSLSTVTNPSHFIDYQDCKFLGARNGSDVMLCSGVSTLSNHRERRGNGGGRSTSKYVLGGIALVDIKTMVPIFELPITLESESGVRMTMNPFDVGVVDGKLRFYWAPDQHNTTLYVYEAQI